MASLFLRLIGSYNCLIWFVLLMSIAVNVRNDDFFQTSEELTDDFGHNHDDDHHGNMPPFPKSSTSASENVDWFNPLIQSPETTTVLYAPQIACPDKSYEFEIRATFSTSNEIVCNLNAFLNSLANPMDKQGVNENCLDDSGRISVKFDYKECNDDSYTDLDIYQFQFSDFTFLFQNFVEKNKNFLFYWNPVRNRIEFVSVGCNSVDDEKKCAQLLNTDRTYLLFRIIDEQYQKMFKLNNDFKYSIRSNEILVLTSNKELYPYTNSWVELELENTTKITLDYNSTAERTEFSDRSLSGQTIMATLYRNGTDIWENTFRRLDEDIGLEIDPNMISMDTSKLADNINQISFKFSLNKNAIVTESNTIKLMMPYKNYILGILKQSNSTIRVKWSKPFGNYDTILLVCVINSREFISTYDNTQTEGQCDTNISISGLEVDIYTVVRKNQYEFVSSDVNYYVVEPNSVYNLHVTEINLTSIEFSWSIPDGLLDYFQIWCTVANQTYPDYTGKEDNRTSTSECTNLMPFTVYEVTVVSVRLIGANAFTSYSKIYARTDPLEFDCTNETCLVSINYSIESLSSLKDNDIILVMQRLSNSVDILFGMYDLERTDKNKLKLVSLIDYSAHLLLNISNRNKDFENTNVFTTYMQLMDKFLNESFDVLKLTDQISNSSDFFITGIEKMSNKLFLTNGNYNADFRNFKIKTTLFSEPIADDRTLGFSYNTGEIFERTTNINMDIDLVQYYVNDSSFKFGGFYNKDVINELIMAGKSPKVTYIGYLTSKFFTTNQTDNIEASMANCSHKRLISSNVLSISPVVDARPDENLVTTIFEEEDTLKNCRSSTLDYSFQCVFWDEDIGDWNTLGCTHSVQTRNNQNFHVCNCNHTTNFALLMIADQISFCSWCDTVLFYVSVIGVSLSIFGLIVTISYDIILSFLPTRDEFGKVKSAATGGSGLMEQYSLMSRQYLKIVITWCFTLLCMNCVYLAFTFYKIGDSSTDSLDNISESRKASCITIGVLLHYFLLVSFCFSLCITILQFFIVYKSFKILKFIILKSFLFSFITPIIAVAVVLIIDKTAYINQNKYCWLRDAYAIFSAILPIGIILGINMVIFFLIVINHSNLIKKRDKYLHTIEKYEKGIKREFVFILTCFLNTGLTWLFGFLVTIPGTGNWMYVRFVYALIFCLLNSTQGFHIFVVYILISKRRRQIFKYKVLFHIKQFKDRIVKL